MVIEVYIAKYLSIFSTLPEGYHNRMIVLLTPSDASVFQALMRDTLRLTLRSNRSRGCLCVSLNPRSCWNTSAKSEGQRALQRLQWTCNMNKRAAGIR